LTTSDLKRSITHGMKNSSQQLNRNLCIKPTCAFMYGFTN